MLLTLIITGVNLKVTPPGAMTPPLPGLFRALCVWLAKAEGGVADRLTFPNTPSRPLSGNSDSQEREDSIM